MGLLDGDAASWAPVLGALAAIGNSPGIAPQPASRLPLAQPNIVNMLANGASGYLQGLKSQQDLKAAQTQNALSGLSLEGYQRLQALDNGGPPSQINFGQNGSAAQPQSQQNPGVLPRIARALFGGQAAQPATPTPLNPPATNTSGGSLLAPNLPASRPASASSGASAGPDASSSQPLFDLRTLMQQYRLMSATPGMGQTASQVLGLVTKALPEGAQLNMDGSISARRGYDQFTLNKALADKGFVANSDGRTYSLAPGYAQGQGQITSAQEWAKVAPQEAINNARPTALRPGGALVSNGRVIAQAPQAVTGVDANGRPFQTFVIPQVSGSGGGLLAGGGAGSAPAAASSAPASPSPANGNGSIPLAFKSAATQQPAPSASPSASGPNVTTGANGQPVVQTGLSPLEKSSQEERGTTLEKYGENLDTASSAAVNNNFLLDQMRRESAGFAMGRFADVEGDLRSVLDGFRSSFFPDAQPSQPLADWQSFSKNSMELTRQVVRATSSRAAAQEFTMISKALPSPTMSQQGFSQIADQLSALNDFNIAKQGAAQSWRQSHGQTLDGFESDWNKNTSPGVFLVGRMSPQSLQTMRDSLSKTAEGRATLGQITTKLQYAAQNGLLDQQ
jgi:hypothetical protein